MEPGRRWRLSKKGLRGGSGNDGLTMIKLSHTFVASARDAEEGATLVVPILSAHNHTKTNFFHVGTFFGRVALLTP